MWLDRDLGRRDGGGAKPGWIVANLPGFAA
jgi:hypothetical protein